MVDWALETWAVTAILAAGLAVVGRRVVRSPAVRHGLWLVVLLRFLIPPVVPLPWGIDDLRERAGVPRSPRAEDAAVSHGSPGALRVSEPARTHAVAELTAAPSVLDPSSCAAGPSPDDSPRAGNVAMPHVASVPGTMVPPSTGPSLAPKAPWSLSTMLVVAWLLGSGLWLTREAARWRRLVRLLGSGLPPGPDLRERVRRAAGRLGVRVPRIRILPAATPPFVALPFRPVLALPEALVERMGEDSLNAILLHELSHLRRRDHWVGLVALAGGCIWWWNPVFWFVRRRVDEHAELACDAVVVESRPDHRRLYAETLIEVTRQWTAAVPSPAPVGMLRPARRAFRRRLTMILNETHRPGLSLGGGFLILVFAAAAVSGQGGAVVGTPPSADDVAEPALPSSDAKPAEPAANDAIRRLEAQIEALREEVRRLRGEEPSPVPPVPAATLGASGDDGAAPPAPAGERVDIVRLATSLVDAMGERDVAKVRCDHLKAAADASMMSSGEIDVAQIHLRTAERKIALLSALARTSLVEAESELAYRTEEADTISALVEVGRAPSSELRAARSRAVSAKARLEMLKEILASVR